MNNIIVNSWITIGELTDIPRLGARRVEVGAHRIAVFRGADDTVYALEDRCAHKAGPLSQGIVHDGCVTCPLHNWVFSLRDGQAQGADEGSVETFPVRIEQGEVQLSLTSGVAPGSE